MSGSFPTDYFFFYSLSLSDCSNSVNLSGLDIPLGEKTSEELSLWLGSSYPPSLLSHQNSVKIVLYSVVYRRRTELVA